MSEIKVEVGQYRLMKREGPLRAFFSMTLEPHGMKFADCRYFVTADGRRWYSMPQKEIKPKEGTTGKSDWMPLVSIYDKNKKAAIEIAVLEALKQADEKAVLNENDKTNNGKVSEQQSTDWFSNL